MAIIASIKDLPDTVADRAVIVAMHRRAPGEQVAKLRPKRLGPRLDDLAARLHAWVVPRMPELGTAEPALPAGLDDRAEDLWEPLLAIAEAAGGD